MSDKQNPSLTDNESAPACDEESTREQGEAPRSYYYDDATGYEIYEEEADTGDVAEGSDEEGH
jgi:hypothetical protein